MPTNLTSDALGKLGEAHFEQLCVRARLFANRSSTWDRTGWDYLVEYPFGRGAAGLDSRPSPPSGLVQVKTVGAKANTIRMRLSSAERLAKYPQAAFICVLAVDDAQEFKSLYVLHVIGDLLSRILKQLRQCEAKSSLRINKHHLTIHYADYSQRFDVSADVIREEIARACGPDPDAYIRMKQKQKVSLGFDTIRYSSSFSVLAKDAAEFTDIMLGIKSGQMKSFSADEIRWGIALPKILSADGEIRIKPVPLKGEMIVRTKSESLTVKVDIFAPPIKGPRVVRRIRLASEIMELVADFDNYAMELITENANTKGLSVRQHLRLIKLQRILVADGSTVECSAKGKRVFFMQPQPDPSSLGAAQLARATNALLKLERVLSQADANALLITVDEVNTQMPRIVLFDEILSAADGYDIVFKAVLTEEPPGLGEITDILLLCYVKFGQSVIALAAVGAASITGIGFTCEIAVTALRAREIETINRNEGAIADFGARMRAESGIEAVLEFGLTSADG